MCNTNRNIFITGRAGTGKSLLLTVFTQAAIKRTLKMAPTGIAALNIGGATVHSVFGYKNLVSASLEEIDGKTLILPRGKKEVLEKTETIIIDEVSMLRSDIVEKMDRILKIVCSNAKPFGGKQMIFIGDPFQLPPIANKEEKYYLKDKFGGIYFYCPVSYKKGDFAFVELGVNHRQNNDPAFFNILNHIREGRVRSEDIKELNDRVSDLNSEEDEYDRSIRLFATRKEVDLINEDCLKRIPGNEYSFETKIVYSKYDNPSYSIESNFPIPSVLKLKVGANVMFVKNDLDRRWVNGTVGIIRHIKNDVVIVAVNGLNVTVKKEEFTQNEAKYENGKIKYEEVVKVEQYPLVLAYAMTIHKSQGMTYKKIACDLSNCFESGQEYVALSRAVSLKGLKLLSPIRKENIEVDHNTTNFYWECLANNA